MQRALLIVTALLVSISVWAEELDKSQSLTIEKKSATNTWISRHAKRR